MKKLTMEQKEQVLLWAFYITIKKLDRECVVPANFYDCDEIEISPLKSLSRKKFIKWEGNFDDDIELTSNGINYLKKSMSLPRSFILNNFNKVGVNWNESIGDSFESSCTPSALYVSYDGDHDFLKEKNQFDYDVAISFSGKDRDVAKALTASLKKIKISVFLDEDEQTKLWGPNLYDLLIDIYSRKSKFCILLISKDYVKSKWANLERQAAQERQLFHDSKYILPIVLNAAVVPGILRTTAYIDYKTMTNDQIASLVAQKILDS